MWGDVSHKPTMKVPEHPHLHSRPAEYIFALAIDKILVDAELFSKEDRFVKWGGGSKRFSI